MSIRSLPCQFLEFMEQNRFICPGVINNVRPSLRVVSKLFCANVAKSNLYDQKKGSFSICLRCVVFVAFFKYFRIRDKSFIPSQNSQHSWNSSLEKPNKLVQVMQWYFVRLCKNKHRPEIRIMTCRLSHSMCPSYFRSPLARAFRGPPYSQGGTGKQGLESDQILVHSASLLIKMNGEHLGTGAGTGRGRNKNI